MNEKKATREMAQNDIDLYKECYLSVIRGGLANNARTSPVLMHNAADMVAILYVEKVNLMHAGKVRIADECAS